MIQLQAARVKAIEDAQALALELQRLDALKVALENESATKIQGVFRVRSAKVAVDKRKTEIEAAKEVKLLFIVFTPRR